MGKNNELINDIQVMLNESDAHFSRGSEIWNYFGVDNPVLTENAARAALTEYQKSVDTLDVNKLDILPEGYRNRILANREQALAQIASMFFFLHNKPGNDDNRRKLEYSEKAIFHLQEAIRYLKLSEPQDDKLLSKLVYDLLNFEGYNANMAAQLAVRNDKINDAIDFYKLAELKFLEIMSHSEAEEPSLIIQRTKIEESYDKDWKDNSFSVDVDGIQSSITLLRTDDVFPILSSEDLYRRAASNYYSITASRGNLEAFDLINNDGANEEAENKMAESIKYIFFSIEAFPNNLEFHSDYFDAWQVKGRIFGCEFVERGEFLHTRCPIAISTIIGKWYVSPTLEFDAVVCSVCGKDILECDHFPGQNISGEIVRYHRQNARITSASLVDVPEDPRCRLDWIAIPKTYFPPKAKQNEELRCSICQVDPKEMPPNPALS